MSFRSEWHKFYTTTSNSIAVTKGENKKSQDEGWIAIYPHRSSISFIKYFNGKRYLFLL